MTNLHFELKHCFGIKAMSSNFNFEEGQKVISVYAPNGTMKTSLAKGFKAISESRSDDIKDIVSGEKGRCSILIDGKSCRPEQISVVDVSAETDEKMITALTSLLVDRALMAQYAEAMSCIDDEKAHLRFKLKELTHFGRAKEVLEELFNRKDDELEFDFLARLMSEIDNASLFELGFDFDYCAVFNVPGLREFLKEHDENLSSFRAAYISALQGTKFLRYLKEKNLLFGVKESVDVLHVLDKSGFFSVGYAINLPGCKVGSLRELKRMADEDICNLKKNPEFAAIVDALGKNKGFVNFRNVIMKQPWILSELCNYDEFHRKVWLSYLRSAEQEVRNVLFTYKKQKGKLESILNQARKQRDVWQRVIDVFNSRFIVPFRVELEDRLSIVIGQTKKPVLSFVYDSETVPNTPVDRSSLLSILSRGELKCLGILQALFEIEMHKRRKHDTIIVLDDIVDSFDYKNKYAFLEYLKELADVPNFYLIVLTHNYDFYRAVNKRLRPNGDNSCVLPRIAACQRGKMQLYVGQDLSEIMESWRANIRTNKLMFFAAIPFVRNLAAYRNGHDDASYKFLTSCLHLSRENRGKMYPTHTITIGEICEIFVREWNISGRGWMFAGNENYLKVLHLEAQNLLGEKNSRKLQQLQTRIVLAMSMRLKLEDWLWHEVCRHGDEGKVLAEINEKHNQTVVLIDTVRHYRESEELSRKRLLEQCGLVVNEHVHLNAFMYEPLMDTGVDRLLRLYKEVSQLYDKCR